MTKNKIPDLSTEVGDLCIWCRLCDRTHTHQKAITIFGLGKYKRSLSDLLVRAVIG
ncbi:hypothetical protein [Fischerella thermalis]|uniref:hypothetical protein n=1 Tax=Fischerella thermalis TaxID=372787 RepID=UPI0015E0D5BA|nr:hypothetical protein [Fischerella thermalis]